MKVYTTLIATLLVIALMTPTVSTQTDRKIDYTQMVEDIEIMCRIIDRNMKELFPKEYHRTGPFKRQGCQGFYLKNYGVIFTLEVQFPVTQKEIPVALKKKQKADLWQELEREVRHLPHQEETYLAQQQGKAYNAEQVDTLKERLAYLIGEYSQRIDQLAPNEKISIVVNSRLEHPLKSPYIIFGPEPNVATVRPPDTIMIQRGPNEFEVEKFPIDETLIRELEATRKKLGTLRKEYDQLRSFPSTTMILTFNENTLRDMTGSDWKQILASADIVQY